MKRKTRKPGDMTGCYRVHATHLPGGKLAIQLPEPLRQKWSGRDVVLCRAPKNGYFCYTPEAWIKYDEELSMKKNLAHYANSRHFNDMRRMLSHSLVHDKIDRHGYLTLPELFWLGKTGMCALFVTLVAPGCISVWEKSGY